MSYSRLSVSIKVVHIPLKHTLNFYLLCFLNYRIKCQFSCISRMSSSWFYIRIWYNYMFLINNLNSRPYILNSLWSFGPTAYSADWVILGSLSTFYLNIYFQYQKNVPNLNLLIYFWFKLRFSWCSMSWWSSVAPSLIGISTCFNTPA